MQPLAGKAWDAAWNIHDWATTCHPGTDDRQAIKQLEDLRGKLRKVATAFADAAQNETAGVNHIHTASTAGNQAGENAPASVAPLLPSCGEPRAYERKPSSER